MVGGDVARRRRDRLSLRAARGRRVDAARGVGRRASARRRFGGARRDLRLLAGTPRRDAVLFIVLHPRRVSAFGPSSGCGGCRGACSVARRGACRSVGRGCGGRRRACGLGRLAVGSRDRDERRRGTRVERVAARGGGGHGVQIRRARRRDEASEAIRRRVQPSLSVGRGAQRGDNRRAAHARRSSFMAWRGRGCASVFVARRGRLGLRRIPRSAAFGRLGRCDGHVGDSVAAGKRYVRRGHMARFISV